MDRQELHTRRHWPAWIAGAAADAGELAEVTHPGDGSVVGTCQVPDAASMEAAIEGAWQVRIVPQQQVSPVRSRADDDPGGLR